MSATPCFFLLGNPLSQGLTCVAYSVSLSLSAGPFFIYHTNALLWIMESIAALLFFYQDIFIFSPGSCFFFLLRVEKDVSIWISRSASRITMRKYTTYRLDVTTRLLWLPALFYDTELDLNHNTYTSVHFSFAFTYWSVRRRGRRMSKKNSESNFEF